MTSEPPSKSTFIIDCPTCKAMVAADQRCCAEHFDNEFEPWAQRVYTGQCPSCRTILVGASEQLYFAQYNAYEDEWSAIVRVFPKPPKSFYSSRIPKVVKDSLGEADRSLQVGANIAGCIMLGRALEAVSRDVVQKNETSGQGEKPRRVMLDAGLKKLLELKVIDQRLYEWSQQLRAFRNLAAHPEDVSISRQDADDLQTFVYALIEFVYDLADRYDEFMERQRQGARDKQTGQS